MRRPAGTGGGTLRGVRGERTATSGRAPVAPAPDGGVESPALAPVSGPVQALLEDFLDARLAELRAIDPALEPVGCEVRDFVLLGGKRLRPAFVYWGYRATGARGSDALHHLGAAVELLHSFALIHDDVMDRSVLRRGRPTVHTALAEAHGREALAGDPAWFGVGGAILAGDLAFVWADQLLDSAPLPPAPLDRARGVFRDLRVEVMAGQYLDLRLAGRPDADEADALRVALLKAGRYTVTRPLELGASAGEPSAVLRAALRAYGDAVGVAFQLRDDVLGLFGDPSRTGKSCVEDLREGKRTLLFLRALALADEPQRRVLEGLLGDPGADEAAADTVRQLVVDTGALTAVEELLRERWRAAGEAIEAVPAPARDALAELAELALDRVA